MKLAISLFTLAFLISTARADDRSVIAESVGKLSQAAQLIAKEAKASSDRGVRKRFATAAEDIGDDLDALARRARKDVAIKTIASELGEIDRDAFTLIDAADEAEDKTERKTLRAAATLLEQGIAAVRKSADAVASKDDDKKKAGPAAMSPERFGQLVAAVRDATMDDDKVSVVRAAASGNNFSAAQIGALMDLISFDSSKIHAAVAAWPRMIDPQNSYTIYGHLSFDSSKDELRKRVGQ